MIGSGEHPLFSFGAPPDAVAWTALILAALVLFAPRLRLAKTRLWLVAIMTFAGVASFGYFHFYLGGAPRVIDATTYLLEARTFARGGFTFEVPDPTASFRGRFLVTAASDARHLAPIFPPGYPTLLAVGVLLGAYWLVGPVLAAALVWVTYRLTLSATHRKRAALLAALLSALSACLRYHTAETMSHGLAAFLSACALWSSVELAQKLRFRFAWLLGASLGLLLATRQLTGLLFGLVCMISLVLAKPRALGRLAGIVALGILPGLALLLLHQHAITGSYFESPQLRYYDLADGPPGCFELGLGSGCAYEHADVVARQGGQGLTLAWAVRNTLHRVHYHLLDVVNFEPLVLVALWFAYRARRRRGLLPLLLALVAVPLGYSLFYFAGSYPGAGARLYAELLPVWHLLLAAGLCALRLTKVGIFACLFGFSVHGSFSHRLLASPHFGPDGSQLEHLPKTSDEPSLVFVSTAHEFNLAHLADESVLVARRTFDDREALLANRGGATRMFWFQATPNGPRVEPLSLELPAEHFTFEVEFDYPPEAKSDLWVHPEHVAHACVSRGRALALHRTGPAPRLTLPARAVAPGTYRVEIDVVDNGACARRLVGPRTLPGNIELSESVLTNVSHIDRLYLTRTHP